jgi:hypothetical protein
VVGAGLGLAENVAEWKFVLEPATAKIAAKGAELHEKALIEGMKAEEAGSLAGMVKWRTVEAFTAPLRGLDWALEKVGLVAQEKRVYAPEKVDLLTTHYEDVAGAAWRFEDAVKDITEKWVMGSPAPRITSLEAPFYEVPVGFKEAGAVLKVEELPFSLYPSTIKLGGEGVEALATLTREGGGFILKGFPESPLPYASKQTLQVIFPWETAAREATGFFSAGGGAAAGGSGGAALGGGGGGGGGAALLSGLKLGSGGGGGIGIPGVTLKTLETVKPLPAFFPTAPAAFAQVSKEEAKLEGGSFALQKVEVEEKVGGSAAPFSLEIRLPELKLQLPEILRSAPLSALEPPRSVFLNVEAAAKAVAGKPTGKPAEAQREEAAPAGSAAEPALPDPARIWWQQVQAILSAPPIAPLLARSKAPAQQPTEKPEEGAAPVPGAAPIAPAPLPASAPVEAREETPVVEHVLSKVEETGSKIAAPKLEAPAPLPIPIAPALIESGSVAAQAALEAVPKVEAVEKVEEAGVISPILEAVAAPLHLAAPAVPQVLTVEKPAGGAASALPSAALEVEKQLSPAFPVAPSLTSLLAEQAAKSEIVPVELKVEEKVKSSSGAPAALVPLPEPKLEPPKSAPLPSTVEAAVAKKATLTAPFSALSPVEAQRAGEKAASALSVLTVPRLSQALAAPSPMPPPAAGEGGGKQPKMPFFTPPPSSAIYKAPEWRMGEYWRVDWFAKGLKLDLGFGQISRLLATQKKAKAAEVKEAARAKAPESKLEAERKRGERKSARKRVKARQVDWFKAGLLGEKPSRRARKTKASRKKKAGGRA